MQKCLTELKNRIHFFPIFIICLDSIWLWAYKSKFWYLQNFSFSNYVMIHPASALGFIQLYFDWIVWEYILINFNEWVSFFMEYTIFYQMHISFWDFNHLYVVKNLILDEDDTIFSLHTLIIICVAVENKISPLSGVEIDAIWSFLQNKKRIRSLAYIVFTWEPF